MSAIVAAGFLCSCNQESLSVGDDQVLMISPALLDIQDGTPSTRADSIISDDELKDNQFNENKIKRLDVFFFLTTGEFVKDFHTDDMQIVERGGKKGYLLSNDWKKAGLVKDVPYKVYIIANSTNPEIISPRVRITEDNLKAKTTTDQNIYKRYKEGAAADDATYSPDKTFLMNATVRSWTIQSMSTQLIGDAKVTMERAAVKLIMDVSLSDKFLERLEAEDADVQYGEAKWKFVNFNTITPEIPEGTVPEPQLLTQQSGGYLTAVPGEEGHYVVTTYAYPQSWTEETANDKAPAILVSYTVVKNGKSNYHYYYIPICAKTVTKTERNKLYKVNAVISSYGSFEVITTDDLELTYEVKDWTSSSADVNAQANDYLVATPTRHSFNGGSVGESQSKTFHYYASGDVEIAQVYAYYKDKNGDATEVTDGFSVSTPSNGTFTITSTVPTNGTFRTVEATVRIVGTNKTQKVIVRHYPADFVTGISSSWCSYDDTRWAVLGESGKTYAGVSQEGNSNRFTFFTSSSDSYIYSARVYYNGNAYYMNRNGERTNTVALSNANNQMYVLQITSANDKYRIGRPTLTTNTGTIYSSGGTSIGTREYVLSNDDVLSPAFMLASQITSMKNSGFSTLVNAALHCSLYKEVDSDGNVYTGWRLPTKQEIEYMIENQISNPNAMTTVVRGHYYWTLDGGKAEFADYAQYGGGNGTWVRCVRDVTPEEIARINQF